MIDIVERPVATGRSVGIASVPFSRSVGMGVFRAVMLALLAINSAALALTMGGAAVAQDYDSCMSHCVPRNGFDSCNNWSSYCGDARGYAYEVCMSYCVPENGFDSCNNWSSYCGDALGYAYEVCMSYCVPENGFDSCNNWSSYCGG